MVPIRNPNETIPSLPKLMRSGWKRLDWDAPRQQRCLRILAEQSFETYRYPLEVLGRHPETRHAIVDYRDLISDPAASIEACYERLGVPMTAAYRETLMEEGKRARQYRSEHAYSLEEFGLESDEIRTRLADLFERYQWDAEAALAPAGRGEA